jgi:hypothetical protein
MNVALIVAIIVIIIPSNGLITQAQEKLDCHLLGPQEYQVLLLQNA